ncbi:PhnA domain-containing protein [Salmonella enterica subsp. enterica]|nr:PhnA domain-containing protein [Salmonella enterica subsp. enterica]
MSWIVSKDANGNLLAHGDSVTIVKRSESKRQLFHAENRTKVKNIRLVEGDHNIDCKIDGLR